MPIERTTSQRLDKKSGGPAIARGAPPAVTPLLAAMTAAVKNSFADKFGAKAENEAEFHDLMRTVFGAGYDRGKAEGYRKLAMRGDFSWLPQVRFVDSATLHGGSGAYDKGSGVVLLSRDQDLANAAETYVEEAAHHLDTELNAQDTKGDEGEMFRRIMAGEKLSAAQIREIRNEDDQGKIVVDGKEIEVEFNLWSSIKKGFKKIGKGIANAAEGAWNGIKAATKGVIQGTGTFFKGLAEGNFNFFKNLFRGKISDAFKSWWAGMDKALIQGPRQALDGLLTGVEETIRGATHLFPGGKYLRKVTDRISDAIRSLAFAGIDIGTSAIRNLGEGGGQFLAGLGKILKGDFKEGLKEMGDGFLKVAVQTPADAVLLGLGKVISAVQTVLGLEPPGRKLTGAEIDTLKQVYGDAIDYDQVRIKEGFAGLFSLNDRAFVHGNTVYMKDNVIDEHLLVHEVAHVWQFQNGGSDYMSEALYSQEHGKGYDWQQSVPGTAFADLEPEQQAEFLSQIAVSGFFTTGTCVIGGVDYTDYARRALESVRHGRGAP